MSRSLYGYLNCNTPSLPRKACSKSILRIYKVPKVLYHPALDYLLFQDQRKQCRLYTQLREDSSRADQKEWTSAPIYQLFAVASRTCKQMRCVRAAVHLTMTSLTVIRSSRSYITPQTSMATM